MLLALRRRPMAVAATIALGLTFAPLSAQPASERVDLDAIYRIKAEGFQRSQIMDIMSWLTDVYGPRLTNAPGFRKAGD
jgi:carboxypeptidase Q